MRNWVMMVISFIVMVVLNALGSTGNLNGQSQEEISNRLNVLFTPDGYVFSIWGLIYLLVAVWLVIQYKRIGTDQEASNAVVFLFIGTCVLNILRLLMWHYEIFVLAQVMMFALLINLIALYKQYPIGDKSFGGRLPFSFYMGWISVATIANMCYTLKHYDITLGIAEVPGTIGLVIIATLLAVTLLFSQRDLFCALVFVWAIIGIGTVNTASSLVTTAYICAALIAIAVVASFVVKRKPVTTT